MRGLHRLLALGALLTGCVTPDAPPTDPEPEIAALLARSAADWNRGDLTGFMSDYAPDSLTSFVAGRGVVYGWQQLHDRYQSAYFSPGASRDSLAFTALVVRPLAPRVALATARFALYRGDSVVASGPFTLVLERRGATPPGRWLIIHDHTSSDPAP